MPGKRGSWKYFKLLLIPTYRYQKIFFAVKEHVSASTKNQALAALLFYRPAGAASH